jgi:hypothetical protein
MRITEDGEEEMEGWQEEEEQQQEEDMDRPMVDMDQDQEEEEGGGEGMVFCPPCLTTPAAQAAALHELLEEYSDDSSVFPPLDGTSFYTNICLMNHACAPNVLVEYVSIPGEREGRAGGVFEGSVQECRGALRRGLCAQVCTMYVIIVIIHTCNVTIVCAFICCSFIHKCYCIVLLVVRWCDAVAMVNDSSKYYFILCVSLCRSEF